MPRLLCSAQLLQHRNLGCRHNQELEQDTIEAEEEKLQLQITADRLSERLDAIMKDCFNCKSSSFDADTPIDKTLNFLSDYIGVCSAMSCTARYLPVMTVLPEVL